MKTTTWIAATALAAFAAAGSFAFAQQDKDKAASKPAPQGQAEAANWMALATPGPAHKVLDTKVGKWTAKVKMTAPGSPPMESTGTSESKWVLDGRFVQDTFQGSMMGAPFTGMGTVGYDNMKKKYVGTWIDNMGTGIMTYEGTYDEAKKTFTYTSEMPDAMSGKFVKARMVEKITDADHWTWQLYTPGPDGKEAMMMEIEYTRQK